MKLQYSPSGYDTSPSPRKSHTIPPTINIPYAGQKTEDNNLEVLVQEAKEREMELALLRERNEAESVDENKNLDDALASEFLRTEIEADGDLRRQLVELEERCHLECLVGGDVVDDRAVLYRGYETFFLVHVILD